MEEVRSVPKLEYEILSSEHDTSKFTCVEQDLNEFLQSDALSYQAMRVSTTYVFMEPECQDIVAYVTLCCDNVMLTENEKEDEDIDPETTFPVPAIKIARLAVHKDKEGRGIGTYLLEFAVGLATDVSEKIGCRFVTVDALPNRVEWYEMRQFRKNNHYYKRKNNVSMRLDLL